MNFNPRLREGGDPQFTPIVRCFVRFQSTPPRGRRQTEKVTGTTTEISIHASAREATSRWRQIEEILNISIHASAREATTDPTGYPTNLGGFQSTPPRGRRLTAKNFTVDAADFNPRLREGGDKSL